MKKIYLDQNVWDASIERFRRLYSEFDNVVVGFSGGKDSVICLELAVIVARELGRLPVKALFLDQEAEWETTIQQVRETFARPEIEGIWLQIPFRIFNGTAHDVENEWLVAWDPGAEEDWMRPKEPGARTENNLGTDRFKEIFGAWLKKEFPDQDACYIAGLRAEESPTRAVTLTASVRYKDITWSKRLFKGDERYWTFYPIWDWNYTDVWKAIHDNGWRYSKLYDLQYQYGVPINGMRLSNLTHETALQSLEHLQEFEKDTWAKLTKRLGGISVVKHLGKGAMTPPKKLPPMFGSWKEYRNYLLEHLITNEEHRLTMARQFARHDSTYAGMLNDDSRYKTEISAILRNDYHLTVFTNWEKRPAVHAWRKWKGGRLSMKEIKQFNPHIHGDSKQWRQMLQTLPE